MVRERNESTAALCETFGRTQEETRRTENPRGKEACRSGREAKAETGRRKSRLFYFTCMFSSLGM